jgi:predicted RNA-binding protein with TRAM domain
MPDCPLADDCPQFSERINGLGCQHYGDKGGAEWCDHYERPIYELKSQPVKVGEEVVVEVTDIHESGAGVGRTDDGFIVLVDGILPDARASVRIKRVKSNHALGEEVERLPWDEDEETGADGESDVADDTETDDADDENQQSSGPKRPEALGSRDNFWGS